MSRTSRYADLVARGCTCGNPLYVPCPVHTEPGDNRGVRAFFEAGMPGGFPILDCTCGECGAQGCLLYPNIAIDDPEREPVFRRTLICPRCSTPSAEARLVDEAEQFGHALNDARVFTAVAAC